MKAMRKMKVIFLTVFLSIFLFTGFGFAEAEPGAGKEYSDGHRGKVFFPRGDISFVDEVVSFEKGNPAHSKSDPENALGTPNDRKATVLGCGGLLTLRFVDNALIDMEGSDLYIFESGQNIEATFLSISKDGKNWIDIGKISGGRADIDIVKFVKPGEVFHYVRLKDAFEPECGGTHPGADINAVGAMGSAVQITMKSSVLFEFGKWDLKPEAKQELHQAVSSIRKFPHARIIIEGHTDRVGSDASNQELSVKRAGAVRNYLMKTEKLEGYKIEVQGYGESRPIASNETEEGRERNRRVELILIPGG